VVIVSCGKEKKLMYINIIRNYLKNGRVYKKKSHIVYPLILLFSKDEAFKTAAT
jgi:hypothetical protein